MRILVIEDEPLICMLATDIIETEGWESIGVGTAKEALAQLHQEHFDAALVDLGLPDCSGMLLMRTLLARHPALRIVISTGRRPDDPLVREAVAQGPDCDILVLSKPWSEEDLRAALRQVQAPGLRGPAIGGTLVSTGGDPSCLSMPCTT